MKVLSGIMVGVAIGWAIGGAWITTLSVRELATCMVVAIIGVCIKTSD